MEAWNMYRREMNKYIKQNCAPSGIYIRNCHRLQHVRMLQPHQMRNIIECTTYETKFQAWRNFTDPRLRLWGRRVRRQDGMHYQYLCMQIRVWRWRGMKMQHPKAQGTFNLAMNFKTYLKRDPVPTSFTLHFKSMRFWLCVERLLFPASRSYSNWNVQYINKLGGLNICGSVHHA